MDKHEKIYLGKKDHIEIWTRKPEKIASWDVINELATITSIAVTDESVFAADAGNKLVYHYNLRGELLNKIGAKDIENGVP